MSTDFNESECFDLDFDSIKNDQLIGTNDQLDEIDNIKDPWSAIESGMFGSNMLNFGIGFATDDEDAVDQSEVNKLKAIKELEQTPISKKGRLGLKAIILGEYQTMGEQIALLLINERVKKCFIDNASRNDQIDGLNWVFSGAFDKYNRTFDYCCSVLCVRPWIIQSRIQFQFYNSSIRLYPHFSFDSPSMPSIIESEAAYYGGDDGFLVANLAWENPGIPHEVIATSKSALKAMHQLEEKGIMSEDGGHWYTTGRNPFLMEHARRTISWSSLWPSNDYY